MLLKNEGVYSILEFAVNRMIISVQLTDLLIAHDWQVVNSIRDGNLGNTQKCWMALLPGFDRETFPFIISSGLETFNLINVKKYTQEPLIHASSKNTRSQ